MATMKKVRNSMLLSLLAGVTIAYFVWLSWKKLTDWIGDTTLVWWILLGIIIVLLATGVIGWKKIIKRWL